MSCLLILDKCALGLMNVLLHILFLHGALCFASEMFTAKHKIYDWGGTKQWDTSVTSILEGHCLLVTIVLGRDK